MLRDHLARTEGGPIGLVFPSATGGVLDQGNVSRQLLGKPVKGQKGVRVGGAVRYPHQPEVDLSWIGFHTTRRTVLTSLAHGSLELARTVAGHKAPATTLRYVDRGAVGVLDLEALRRALIGAETAG